MTSPGHKWPRLAWSGSKWPYLNLNDLIFSFWRDEETWCLQRMFYFMNLQRPVFLIETKIGSNQDLIFDRTLTKTELLLDFDLIWPNLTFEWTWTLQNLSFITGLDENHEKQELLIERAQGQYLIDNDGEHYLDLINNVAHGKFSSGFWFGWMVQVIWSVSRLRSHTNLFSCNLWVAANISFLFFLF